MPKRAMLISTIALGTCVSFYATGANAQSVPVASPGAPAQAPQVMIVVEQPPQTVVVAPPAPVEQPRPTAPKGKEEETWYGYQTLIVDGASLGLVLGGAAMAGHPGGGDSGGSVAVAGGIGYLLGAPVVHWMHGRIGPGLGSLGLRVGLPLAGMFWGAIIGAAANDRHGEVFSSTGLGIGFVAGVAGAMLLDTTLLAYEKPSEKEKEAYEEAKAKRSLRWMPNLAPQKSGGTVGVSGVFF
jgi:hypothetical protein